MSLSNFAEKMKLLSLVVFEFYSLARLTIVQNQYFEKMGVNARHGRSVLSGYKFQFFGHNFFDFLCMMFMFGMM